METLQERFIKSSGAAVKVGNKFVVQSDIIDLQEARLKVKFCGENENCGIALRAIDGKVRLSDAVGQKTSCISGTIANFQQRTNTL